MTARLCSSRPIPIQSLPPRRTSTNRPPKPASPTRNSSKRFSPSPKQPAASNGLPATARVGDCFSHALFIGADDGVHLAALLVVDDDARDGGDVVLLREVALLVDIHLLQHDIRILFCEPFQNRTDAPTRAAPIGIEIDDRDFAMLGLDGSPGLRARIGLGSRRWLGTWWRWLAGCFGVRAAGSKIDHLNRGDMSWRTIGDAHRNDTIFQAQQLSIDDRVILHGNRGYARIEIDPLDLLKFHVGHAAVFIGELESLVKEGQDAPFGFRAVLEFDHVRASAKAERNPNANWQYSFHWRI